MKSKEEKDIEYRQMLEREEKIAKKWQHLITDGYGNFILLLPHLCSCGEKKNIYEKYCKKCLESKKQKV